MKKVYLTIAGIGFLLSICANLATSYYFLIPEIILFFCYGLATYFLARAFKDVSPGVICLILICLQVFGQLIAAVITPQFHLYMLINSVYFLIGTLCGLIFYKGKRGLKILTVVFALIFSWYYQNVTRVNREFPAADMYEQLKEFSMQSSSVILE